MTARHQLALVLLSALAFTFAIDSGGVVRAVTSGALVSRQLSGISRPLRTDG